MSATVTGSWAVISAQFFRYVYPIKNILYKTQDRILTPPRIHSYHSLDSLPPGNTASDAVLIISGFFLFIATNRSRNNV